MSDRYVVIGNPVAQSQSPFIHSEFAKQAAQTMEYKTLLANLDSFEETVYDFFAAGGQGANITVPFKEEALRLCDELTERAKSAGAVNTLYLTGDGKLKGDNTDGYGLITDLQQQFGSLEGKRLLILGAGGATRGCLLPLLAAQVEHIIIANRTESKAFTLVNEFENSKISAASFEKLDQASSFDIIINATAASLSGDIPDIKSEVISPHTHCYDMVYSNKPTAFVQWANDNNANKAIDGLGMLVHQAAKSFEIWRGIEPDAEKTLQALRNKLREAQ